MKEFLAYDIGYGFQIIHAILCGVLVSLVYVIINIISVLLEE
ncbi:MAG: hypothetical protein Q7J27_14625 [Syntrophales bacterium]|nr:hypothetical protein [Syntrophales bacterium]